MLRYFASNSFSNSVDPGNTLAVSQNGGMATFNSLADIVEAHDFGVMQASDAGDGSTLLTMPSGALQLTVQLESIQFSSLGIGGLKGTSSGTSGLVGASSDGDLLLGLGDEKAIDANGPVGFALDGFVAFLTDPVVCALPDDWNIV